MWKRLLLITVILSGVSLLWVTPVIASTTATFTVTATGDIGAPAAPVGLTVTLINDNLVEVDWTPTASTNTTIRVKYDSPPTSKDDGYLLYYGEGATANDTFLNMDVMWSKQYYIASAYNAENGLWSDYIYAYVENPKVTEIANQLGDFNTQIGVFNTLADTYLPVLITGILAFLVLIIFSVLAFWKENYILFIITFGISWVVGLNAPDIISGAHETTSIGLAFGVMLLAYGLFCAGVAFKLMFWRSDNA